MKEELGLVLGRIILEKEEPERVLSEMVERITCAMDADTGFIYLAKTKDLFAKVASFGTVELSREIKRGVGVMGEALVKESPVLVHQEDMSEWKDVRSLIIVPLRDKVSFCGICGLIHTKDDFTETDLSTFSSLSIQINLALEIFRLRENIYDGVLLSTIRALVSVTEAIDPNLRGHSWNVARLSVALATNLELLRAEREAIKYAALLHGIGRIGIPEKVWKKEAKLAPEEWEAIKTHTIIGEKIAESADFPFPVAEIVRAHHERWDGKGYPDGLKGEQIPLGARVVAIANAWDAMISERPYRKSKTIEEAKEEIEGCAGTQFDPDLVKIFLKMLER
jgi:putative nucleotidyltransferase with HDIG domain